MVIWIESKNPSLYSSGISIWLLSLIEALKLEEDDYKLAGPRKLVQGVYENLRVSKVEIPWIAFLPRKINHLLYDNIFFRYYSWKSNVTTVFAPYYDVSVSKRKSFIPTIHDLCYVEVPEVYSNFQRRYFTFCLKRAVRNSIAIVTVSNTTKNALISHFNYPKEKVLVIPNQVDHDFLQYRPSQSELEESASFFGTSEFRILYTGGFENRKNVERLLKSLCVLRNSFPNLKLCITGDQVAVWSQILSKFPELKNSILLPGKVNTKQLKTLYLVSDVVVYPSLSEGYGRACIEAMSTGTPLACSDIPVFHEVAGDYAIYFDPLDINSIANGISLAKNKARVASIPILESIANSDLLKLKELLLGGDDFESNS